MRINKYLAACGIGSRRSVEGLVRSGKIFVDSKKITDLSFQVDPEKDQVEYKGQKLHIENKVYYLVNKPKDFVSTVKDINVRHKVTSLVPKDQRVFPVGRLDKDSSGLIILTNDGEFAKNYFRPKFEIEKEYIVEVKRPTENLTEMLDQAVRFFRCGIVLDGTRTKPAFIRVISQDLKKITCNIILKEGKNRQIRRTFARAGLDVKELKRVRIGSLKLGNIKEGEFRKFVPENAGMKP